MSEALVIVAVGLLFAAFALLHRRVEAKSCSQADRDPAAGDGCEGCSHSTDCTEQ